MGIPRASDLGPVTAACREAFADNLMGLAVFGSVGRGTATPASDVDLLVILRERTGGRTACLAQFAAVEQHLARVEAGLDVSPVFRTVDELRAGFPLLLDMVDDAQILHDPEGRLTEALDRLRARLRALGARRIAYKGSWYWDLKPDYRPGEVFSL